MPPSHLLALERIFGLAGGSNVIPDVAAEGVSPVVDLLENAGLGGSPGLFQGRAGVSMDIVHAAGGQEEANFDPYGADAATRFPGLFPVGVVDETLDAWILGVWGRVDNGPADFSQALFQLAWTTPTSLANNYFGVAGGGTITSRALAYSDNVETVSDNALTFSTYLLDRPVYIPRGGLLHLETDASAACTIEAAWAIQYLPKGLAPRGA